jgi:integrase
LYDALTTGKDKALFLLYATSGLRRMEILSFHEGDVDFDKRRIIPKNHNGTSTKNSWVSFYNYEVSQVLQEYRVTFRTHNHKLFPMARPTSIKLWKDAREQTS